MSPLPTITYVDTASTGHCPGWVRAVSEAFEAMDLAYRLNVWLPLGFGALHQDWAGRYFSVRDDASARVRFRAYAGLFGAGEAGDGAWPLRHIISRCSRADDSRVCFIANNVDRELQNVALGRYAGLETTLVGVMDFPILHYGKLGIRQKRAWLPRRRWIKRYILNLMATRRRVMGRILMMDPFGTAFHRRITMSRKYHFLPESYSTTIASSLPRIKLDLPPEKITLLFIGGTERRKGICELLEGLRLAFRRDTELRSIISMVVAGRVISETRDQILPLIAQLRDEFPAASIHLRDGLLSDQEFADYMACADIVCMPYRHFVGTSGVLVHAARASRPVLAPEFGVVGELVRHYGLGLACDTATAESLSEGLRIAIARFRNGTLLQVRGMKDFIKDCAVPADDFGREIVGHLAEMAGS